MEERGKKRWINTRVVIDKDGKEIEKEGYWYDGPVALAAEGDLTVFEEAKAYMIEGGLEAADDFKCAILDNTTGPAAADANPTLGSYSQVGSAGSYTAGGISIGDLGTLVSEAGGVMTFDSTTNPTWPQNGSNDTDAFWGLIYDDTDATKRAFAYVDLGGPKDMAGGALTVTWAVTGIYTIT